MAAVVPQALATQHRAVLDGPRLEGSGARGGYSPADLRSAYNLSSHGGAGLTLAITVAFDYPKAESDLAAYREAYGLPPCTGASGCLRKVNQRGEGASYPEARPGWSAEAALDLDMASAICPECKLLLVEADDNTPENLLQAVGEAATLGAEVISDSWGGPEFAEEITLDPYLDHPGVPVLFASGDAGYRVEYPAASPDVIAVGGTSLSKEADARGWHETAWAGAGSGCSAFEEKPSWQHDQGCARRTVADVAAVADPQTPVSVYDTYGAEYEGWELIGGTSAATPIMAGVEALLGPSERAEGAGLFAKEGSEGALFDIAEGRNGSCPPEADYLCHAQLGYDGPTGWGTPGAPRPAPPVVATDDATEVLRTEATLNGAVNPRGSETIYRFEYGQTQAYGSSVPVPDGVAHAGSEALSVSAHLSGLELGIPYHYRLVATNQYGTSYGGDQSFETSTWAVQYVPRTQQAEELTADSCPSATFCMSVGAQDVYFEPPKLFFNPEALAARWDGGRWVREAPPVVHRAGRGYYSRLEGVSCTSPEFCMAIGENYELEPGFQPLAELWDGSRWSIVPMPMPGEAPVNPGTGQREVRMHGISCTSATSCVAVGQFTRSWDPSSEERDALVEHWDGSSWTVVPSPDPTAGTTNVLWGVSCVSALSCVAVGESITHSGSMSALIEHWDGAVWSIDTGPRLVGALQGVSCLSNDMCVAVGASEGRSGGDGIAEIWNGVSWVDSPIIEPMRAVSCLRTDWCAAAGGGRTGQAMYASIWNGMRWVSQRPTDPSDQSGNPMELYGVSCEASGCKAVGWYDSFGSRPLAENLDRGLLAPLPSVVDDPVGPLTSTTAVLNAHVDYQGALVGLGCRFEVTLRSAPDAPVADLPCTPEPPQSPGQRGQREGDVAVEAQATVLVPDTEYVYRVVASNESGTRPATPDEQFRTSPAPSGGAPEAPMTETCPGPFAPGRVCGTLNPNSSAKVGYHFAYNVGADCKGGSRTAGQAETEGQGIAVEDELSGLAADTTYAFCLVATGSGGEAFGVPLTFRTSPYLAALPEAPITETCPAALGPSRVCGTLNPNSSAKVGYYFAYNVGADCKGGSRTATHAEMEGHAIAVEEELSGLAAETTYAVCLVAQKGAGEAFGEPVFLNTSPSEPPPGPVPGTNGPPVSEGTSEPTAPVSGCEALEGPRRETCERLRRELHLTAGLVRQCRRRKTPDRKKCSAESHRLRVLRRRYERITTL